MFCDLRGFTAFTETVEPEELMLVLGEYHAALGDLVHRYEGTLDRFTGDGLMVFFNDPLPCPDAPERAVRDGRGHAQPRRRRWPRAGAAWATTSASPSASRRATRRSGGSGYEGRFDYAAIGTVTNLAARLCAEARAGPDPRSASACTPPPRIS